MSKLRPFAHFVGERAVVLDKPAGAYNPVTQVWEDPQGMPVWEYGGPSQRRTGYKGVTNSWITSPCGYDTTYDYDDSDPD